MAKTINGTVLRVSSTLITIVVLVVGVVYGYATLNEDVRDNCSEIAALLPIVDANHDAIIGIHKDLAHLSEKVNENSVTQKQILTIQQQILVEVQKK